MVLKIWIFMSHVLYLQLQWEQEPLMTYKKAIGILQYVYNLKQYRAYNVWRDCGSTIIFASTLRKASRNDERK